MFELGDWVTVPHADISGAVWFIDDQYITVTIKCDLQDSHARCPYDITCVVVPREKWSSIVVHPEKKIHSLDHLRSVYAGTSEKRIATFKTSGKPLREHQFDENELKYLGVREVEEGAGNHYYLIAGEYEVCVDQIEDFERVN